MRRKTNILLLIGILILVLASCKTTRQMTEKTSTTQSEKTQDNIVQTSVKSDLSNDSTVVCSIIKDSVFTVQVSDVFSAPDSTGYQYLLTRTTTTTRNYHSDDSNLKSSKSNQSNLQQTLTDKSKKEQESKLTEMVKSKSTVSGTAIYKYLIFAGALALLLGIGYLFWPVIRTKL